MLSERQLFLRHVAQTSDAPMMLEIERAEGIYLYDVNGKAYIDLISGISVSSIGHRHPVVISAIEFQLKKYLHLMVYGEYVQSPQVKYATLLATLLPKKLNTVYFTNSGTEATEGAMKLAKRLTGRTSFVSFHNSYHGHTQGALSIMGNEYWKQAFRPLLPGNQLLHFNELRGLEKITTGTAAVIMEPVQAEAGIILPANDFLKLVRSRCDETGALMILDEIQTGMGRTGTLFCFEHYGIVPDILLTAKAFGGGMPLGAFISSAENMQSLTHDPVLGHLTTFGGHPVSCAAGHAALEVLLKENLMSGVEYRRSLFEKYLTHPAIKSFRSIGLLIALEFEQEVFCKKVIANCIASGVITDWFLFAGNCLRIAPPLTITELEIISACELILHAIQKTINQS
ncbi:MAG: aminotransferase class III-fold pyridoxal phosphate-dependent enzyme [Chitinophagales bacterium]